MGIKLIKGNAEDGGYILENNIHVSFRELQMLMLLARGQEQKEIAKDLGIGVSTVRNHIYNAMMKLSARNRSQAIVKAIENGIFEVIRNKDVVGWSPEDFIWCWKCGRVFTAEEVIEEENEPIEINHVMVDVPPNHVCPYCRADLDFSCSWKELREDNPELPELPDRERAYPNLDYVPSYERAERIEREAEELRKSYEEQED